MASPSRCSRKNQDLVFLVANRIFPLAISASNSRRRHLSSSTRIEGRTASASAGLTALRKQRDLLSTFSKEKHVFILDENALSHGPARSGGISKSKMDS